MSEFSKIKKNINDYGSLVSQIAGQIVDEFDKISSIKGPLPNNVSMENLFMENNNSSSMFSDLNAIKINHVTNLSVFITNTFSGDEYRIVSQYLTGKQLKDIIDENGNLKEIDFNNIEMSGIPYSPLQLESINKKISNTDDLGINQYVQIVELNPELENLTIHEIVKCDSGYEALVLTDENGNYSIVSTYCNEKSPQDLFAVEYSVMNYLWDPMYVDVLLPTMLMQNQDGNSYNDYLSSISGNELRDSQVDDCYKLMKKYTKMSNNENVNVEFLGYSLGGGITSSASVKFKALNPDLYDSVDAITIYNPWLLMAQDLSFPSADNTHNVSITDLKDDEKFTIFSSEGDFVSTFNDLMPDLKDRFVFVPARSIQPVSNIENYHNIYAPAYYNSLTEEEKKAIYGDQLQNFNNIVSYIVMRDGNHGIECINFDSFDSDGNLINYGSYKDINVLFAEYLNLDYDIETITNSDMKPNLPFITNNVINYSIPEEIYNNPNMKYFKPALEYMINSAGNVDKEEFVDIIIECLASYTISNSGSFIVNHLVFENKDTLKEYLLSNEEYITSTLSYILCTGDTGKINELINDCAYKLAESSDSTYIIYLLVNSFYGGNWLGLVDMFL